MAMFWRGNNFRFLAVCERDPPSPIGFPLRPCCNATVRRVFFIFFLLCMTEISKPWHIIYFLRISFFKTLWPMQFWYVNPSHALVSFRHFTMACLMFCTLWTVAWLVFCTLWTVAWLAFCTLATVAWLVFCTVWTVAWIEWVSEWLNLIAFLGTADSEVHIVHMSREITAYILKSLSSLT